MRKICALTIFVGFLVGLVVGGLGQVNQDPNRDDLKYGGTLVIGRGIEPVTMDSVRTMYGDQAHMLISEPPFQAAPDAGTEDAQRSGWLESFSASPDGLIFTFYIRKGVTFHDGEPLDAEAFAWRINESLARPDLLAGVPEWEYISEVNVLDEYTLEIKLSHPRPMLLACWTMPCWYGAMETPYAWERYEDYGHKVAYGNGPFIMTEWVKGDHMTFIRNEDYDWGPGFVRNPGPPYLEKVEMKFIPEAYTRYQMLASGEIDAVLEIPFSLIEEIEELEGIRLLRAPSQKLLLLSYNVTKSPLDELKVRQALNYAIDRQAIADKLFFGYAEPAYSIYMAKSHNTPQTELLYHYNPDKARDLLEEAGWGMGSDGIREKNGTPLEFELWTSEKTIRKRICESTQAMWRAIGVKANVRTFDETTLRAKVEAGEHEATLFRHEWALIDQVPWLSDPSCVPWPHQTYFDTPELRALIDECYSSTTFEEYHEATDAIANYIAENATRCPIVRPDNILAIKDIFENVKLRGPGWWGWLPFLQDVYRKDVYQ